MTDSEIPAFCILITSALLRGFRGGAVPGLTPPVNPPEPPIDAAPPDFTVGASIPFEAGVLLAFPGALLGFAGSSVAPPWLGAAGVALAGAVCGCESMPPELGACGSNMEGAVGRGAAAAADVSLKLMLYAP
jgi:hypothetical protein